MSMSVCFHKDVNSSYRTNHHFLNQQHNKLALSSLSSTSWKSFWKISWILSLITFYLLLLSCLMVVVVRSEPDVNDISCDKLFKGNYVIKSVSARGHRLYMVYGYKNDSTSIFIVRSKVRYFFNRPLFHLDLSRFARVPLLESNFNRQIELLRGGWLYQFIYLRKKRILVSFKAKNKYEDDKYKDVDFDGLQYFVYMENSQNLLSYAESKTMVDANDLLLLYHFTTLKSYPTINNDLSKARRYHDYYEFNDDDDDDDSKDPNLDQDGKYTTTYLLNFLSTQITNLSDVIFADGEIRMGNYHFSFDPYQYKVLHFGFNKHLTQLIVCTSLKMLRKLHADFIPFNKVMNSKYWRVFLHFDHVYMINGNPHNNSVYFFRDFMISQNLRSIDDDEIIKIPVGRMGLSDFFKCPQPVLEGHEPPMEHPPNFPSNMVYHDKAYYVPFVAMAGVAAFLMVVVIILVLKVVGTFGK